MTRHQYGIYVLVDQTLFRGETSDGAAKCLLFSQPSSREFTQRRRRRHRERQKSNRFRACLHGGGGPQVGEVTRLGEVKK